MTSFRTAALLLLFAVTAAAADSAPALSATSMRAKPNDGAKAVAEIKKGDALVVLQTTGLWSEVKTAGGKQGWVPTRVVVATELPTNVAEVTIPPRHSPAHHSQPTVG